VAGKLQPALGAVPAGKAGGPPALAPFAKDDPIPAVQLTVHEHPRTPRAVAESFLAHLTRGYGVPGLSIIGADPMAYKKTWSLLGPSRPPLDEFTKRWGGTVALKDVQFEPAQDHQFFVELQALERCGVHWSVSFHSGFLKTMRTDAGWRVQSLEIAPEDLLGINVASHQGWQHDETLMAKWVLPGPPVTRGVPADRSYAASQSAPGGWPGTAHALAPPPGPRSLLLRSPGSLM
jgi:hypothetical protein